MNPVWVAIATVYFVEENFNEFCGDLRNFACENQPGFNSGCHYVVMAIFTHFQRTDSVLPRHSVVVPGIVYSYTTAA